MTDSFDPQTAVTVGRIVTAHGLRGEVKVDPATDFPERFRPGNRVWVDGEPLEITSARDIKALVYLAFRGIADRAAAEALRGKEIKAAPMGDLGEGQFYQHQIIGLEARDPSGRLLGRIEEIFPTGSNDVYVVRGPEGEMLLPATDDVIRKIDVAAGFIEVELMEGLEWDKPKSLRPEGNRGTNRAARRPARGVGTPSPSGSAGTIDTPGAVAQ